MITGADHVILTASRPTPAIAAFLDQFSSRWPELRVDAHGRGFEPWTASNGVALPDQGEILVARDRAMESDWDEYGYDLLDQEEGPFMLMYRECPVPSFAATVLSDPYGHSHGQGHDADHFEPYPVHVAGRGIYLVTVVTPTPTGANSFAATVMDRLLAALGQASQGHDSHR